MGDVRVMAGCPISKRPDSCGMGPCLAAQRSKLPPTPTPRTFIGRIPQTRGRPRGALSFRYQSPLRMRTGVAAEDLSEVVRAVDRRESRAWVVQEQERPELGRRRPSEGVLRTGDVDAAELPDAADAAVVARAVDRIEVRPRRRVDAVRPGAAVAVAPEVGRLDPRQVGLEGNPAVVRATVEGRAREQDRPRMEDLVLPCIRVRAGPAGLVRDTVEVVVGGEAAAHLDT